MDKLEKIVKRKSSFYSLLRHDSDFKKMIGHKFKPVKNNRTKSCFVIFNQGFKVRRRTLYRASYFNLKIILSHE